MSKPITLRPATELFQRLMDIENTHFDQLVPFKQLRAVPMEDTTVDNGGAELIITDLGIEVGALRVKLSPNAIVQIANRTGEKAAEVPAAYIRKLADTHNADSVALAVENLNHWLTRRAGETHKNGKGKQHLLRIKASASVRDEHGKVNPKDLVGKELMARAVLSDRFLPIDNLSTISTLVQVMTDKFQFDRATKDVCTTATNWAKGAVTLNWALTDDKMDVCLMNPGMAFDLKHPERGVLEMKYSAPNGDNAHAWIRPDGGTVQLQKPSDDGGHYVFPAARITNSETGNGGATVTFGLFEAACVNTAMIGVCKRRAHIGSIMTQEDDESSLVRDRRLQLVYAMLADSVRAVFEPEVFKESCRKFLNLFDEVVEDVPTVIESVCRLPGLTIDMAKMILESYAPMTPGKNTLGDVQRAVTNVAHDFDGIDPEAVRALQDAGGAIIERGMKALQPA